MNRKIDIVKAIRTFQIVVEQGSFSQAANRIGIVVSAVSKQVADLEQHLGCQLLYRTTRAMSLTAEGHYYLEQFQELVERLDRLENRADTQQHNVAGHLRISVPPDAEQLGITRLLSEFVKQHPSVSFTLMLINRYVNLVEEGIDLAVRVHRLPDSRLIGRQLTELNVLYVASPKYLKAYGRPIHPKQLSEHRCVIDTSNRTPGRWRYTEDGAEKHVSVSGPVEVNSGSIAADFCADGHGIAHLPDFLVQRYLDSGQLVPILEPFQLSSIPVSLVYPANRMKNTALSELVSYLINNIKSPQNPSPN
ncbi:LysR family transcriptional regulator [Motiliproteus coralliicola]|uniref:LysR family transcriptional regulator n=1 Tax=Motiliproteus coralliicola TaxID=2283196 RepID=A0A369WKM3_9GAMM|nr:LysR family transcriptional regulator [Motiliproteus coralliicola]RDE22610.1 LysR family transcriptional regulator [Motiliproteus coralliicola]